MQRLLPVQDCVSIMSSHVRFSMAEHCMDADFDMSQYQHPNRIAPRCLPCNYTDPAEGPPNNKTYVGFRAPRVSFSADNMPDTCTHRQKDSALSTFFKLLHD